MRAFAAVLLCLAGLAAGEPPGVAAALGAIPAKARWSLAVADCATGEWLVRRQADRPCAMASVTKILVAAAALRRLGPAWRMRTRLVASDATAAPETLTVIGGGDPTFDEHFYDGDPGRAFADWAARLHRSGVRRVGALVVDGSLFSGPIRPATYPQGGNNPIAWFSAPSSAFAFNDNCISVRAVPQAPGEPCRIDLRPDSPRIAVINRTRSAARGGDRTFQVDRARDADAVTVTGTYSEPTAWFDMAIHADPDLMAADHLAKALAAAGIAVGEVRRGAAPAGGKLLIEHRTPLLPALTLMNQRSQNHYAEQILRLVGVAAGGTGSIDAGREAVAGAIAELVGGRDGSLTLLDGSGLSYGNLASADLLVRVLLAMDRDEHADAFRGTLKEKPAAGVAGRVKTGTLAVATCLAGYIEGRRRLAFAMLFNAGETGGVGWAPAVREQVYLALAKAAR